MIEAMQTEECLNSQTCCEGGRLPWNSRKDNYLEVAKYVQAEIKSKESNCEVKAVIQERETIYGPPEVNLTAFAKMLDAYNENREPGRPSNLQDACAINIMQKLCRLARTPGHKDGWLDIEAYARMGSER